MPDIVLPNGWTPRPYQLPAWCAWEAGAKRSLLVWHRRAGKDDVSLHKAAVAAHMRVGNYWHMLPEYAQARKAVWNAVNPHTGRRRIDEAFPRELRASTNEQEMFIRFANGSTWQLMGSDRYDSLVGTPPIGVVMSEFALANPSAWGYLAPILLENGGWADFITTPRGKNHVHGMLKMAREKIAAGDRSWFAEVLPYTATGAVTDAQVEDQRAEYHALYGEDAGDALIEQEYLCSFDAAILGAYWGKALTAADRAGRMRALKLDPALPVHTAWDIGVGDSNAIWFFQIRGREILVYDYYEANNVGFEDHYAEVLRSRPYLWETRAGRKVRRGDDWVPHDAKVKEWGTGRTRLETMIRFGAAPRLVPDHGKMDGINAARVTIPRVWWNVPQCEAGIERLRQYRQEWDDEKKTFRDNPRHDWTSHGADAFRYLAVAWRSVAEPTKAKPGRVVKVGAGSTATLEDLYGTAPAESTRI